jgi:hypothetical protein
VRASGGFQEELELEQGKFRAQIESLNRKLEVKQAELDFLKAHAGAAVRSSSKSPGRSRNTRKQRKSRQGVAGAELAK